MLAGRRCVNVLELVGLPPLMALSTGLRDVVVGLLDGPVALDHAELTGASFRKIGKLHKS